MIEEEPNQLRRPLIEAGMDLLSADGRAGLGALLRELERPEPRSAQASVPGSREQRSPTEPRTTD